MGRNFNLTCTLNLAGPTNLRPVVSRLTTQLRNINAGLPAMAGNMNTINAAFAKFNLVLKTTSISAKEAAAALVGLNNAVRGVNINSFNNSLRTHQKVMKDVGKVTKDTGNQVAEFGRVGGLALRRFVGFAVATGVVVGFIMKMREGIKEAIDFQHQMVRLSQLTGTSTGQIGYLAKTITDLSVKFGVSSKELMGVTDVLVQAGLSASETRIALSALAKSMLLPTFDNITETGEAAIAIMAQFKMRASDLEGVIGSMNTVAAKFAVESSDIASAVRIAGGAFATMSSHVVSGQEALNQFMALFTSIRATTRESAESIATGMRTIFTRLARPETIGVMRSLGVELGDAEGRFIGVYEAVEKISNALRSMKPGDVRFTQLAEVLGGYRQINKVLPMMIQAETRTRALQAAQEGQAGMAEEVAKAQESWTRQLIATNERFLALIRTISNSGSFKALMDTLLGLANAFIQLGEAMAPVLPYLGLLMGAKAVMGTPALLRGYFSGVKGRARPMATGGRVPGVGDSDTVPAMLTPGEFVLNKKAVSRIGINNLLDLNAATSGKKVVGGVQHFAGGGFIERLANDMAWFSPNLSSVGFNKAVSSAEKTLMFLEKSWRSQGMTTIEVNKRLKIYADAVQQGVRASQGKTLAENKSRELLGLDAKGRGIGGRGPRVTMGQLQLGGFIGATLLNQMAPENRAAQTLSGGLGGMAMGAMLGVPGAIAGGIVGAYSSFEQVGVDRARKLADESLLKSTKALDDAFQALINTGSSVDLARAGERAEYTTKLQREAEYKQYSTGFVGMANMFGASKNDFTGRMLSRMAKESGWGEIFGDVIIGGLSAIGVTPAQMVSMDKLDANIAKELEIERQRYLPRGELVTNTLVSLASKGKFATDFVKDTGNRQSVVDYVMAYGSNQQRRALIAAGEAGGSPEDILKRQFALVKDVFLSLVEPSQKAMQHLKALQAAAVSIGMTLEALASNFSRVATIASESDVFSTRAGQRTQTYLTGAIYNPYVPNMAANPQAYTIDIQQKQFDDIMKNVFGGHTPDTLHSMEIVGGVGRMKPYIQEMLNFGDDLDENEILNKLMESFKKVGVDPLSTLAQKYINETRQLFGEEKGATWGRLRETGKLKSFGSIGDTILSETGALEMERNLIERAITIRENIVKALETQQQTQLKLNDGIANLATLQTSASLVMGQTIRPHEITWQEAYNPLRARIGAMGAQFGVGANNATNITAISDRMRLLMEERERLRQQANETPGMVSNETLKALNKIETQIKSGNALLDVLHTDNTKIVAIQNEVSNIAKRRESAQATALDIFTMDPNQRAMLGQQLQSFREFQKTGNLPVGWRGNQAIQGGQFLMRSGLLKSEEIDALMQALTKAAFRAVGFNPIAGGRFGAGAKDLGKAPGVDKLLLELKNAQDIQIGAAGVINIMGKEALKVTAENVQVISKESTRVKEELEGKVGGGLVGGVFAGGDSKLIRATPGEFVVNRRAARENLTLLRQINSSQRAGLFSPREARQQILSLASIAATSGQPIAPYVLQQAMRKSETLERQQWYRNQRPEAIRRSRSRENFIESLSTQQGANADNLTWTQKFRLIYGSALGSAALTSRVMGANDRFPDVESLTARNERIHRAVALNRAAMGLPEKPSRLTSAGDYFNVQNRIGAIRANRASAVAIDIGNVDKFANAAQQLKDVNLPTNIKLEGSHHHIHNIMGGDALTKIIIDQIKETLSTFVEQKIRNFINPNTGETSLQPPGVPMGN